MKKVDCLILFEHKSRELQSVCLLKYELERRGLSVAVEGAFPNREMLPLKYKVKYLFTPWYYTGTKYIANFLKHSPNAIIINLHQEQYEAEGDNTLVPKGEARYVYHLTWGEAFKEDLIKVGCELKTIINVGSLRLDFLKDKLKTLLPSKKKLSEEFGIDENKRWCLFIADNSHLMEEYQMDEVTEHGKIILRVSKASRECFLKNVEQYLRNNKDIVFIYRPHPCMSNKDLKSKDIAAIHEKYPNNFFCIYNYPLNAWLINCEVCYSFASSSLIETYFAKSQYYLFRKENLAKEFDYAFFHNYKYIVQNYDQFIDSLEGSSYDFNYIADKLKYWYDISEEYSFRRLVDYVLSIDNNVNRIKYKKKDWCRNFLEAYEKEILITVARIPLIKRLLLTLHDNRLNRILGDNEDIVGQEEINCLVQRIQEINP